MTVYLKAEPPREDVLFVALNMRPRDREEIFATQWTDDPEEITDAVMRSGAFRWGVYIDGMPVAMIGATPRWPRVWTAWAFGTRDWRHAALTITRHVLRFMKPALIGAGALRIDAYALATHNDANKWLKALGSDPGMPLANWGKNGETFVQYSWLRKDNSAPATAGHSP